MIEVYHTSNMHVRFPDTAHSRNELDFGPGFYFTTLRHQAEKYSGRFLKRGQKAWLNIYDFNEDMSQWKVKRFDSYNEEWLDFVMSCRAGDLVGNYDIVIGGVANDRIFNTLTLYLEHLISKAEALDRLAFEEPNIQYCIRNEQMLTKHLTFKEVIQL